jgi:hypothetical protein
MPQFQAPDLDWSAACVLPTEKDGVVNRCETTIWSLDNVHRYETKIGPLDNVQGSQALEASQLGHAVFQGARVAAECEVGEGLALVSREVVEEVFDGRGGPPPAGWDCTEGESIQLERKQRRFLIDAATHEEYVEVQRAVVEAEAGSPQRTVARSQCIGRG